MAARHYPPFAATAIGFSTPGFSIFKSTELRVDLTILRVLRRTYLALANLATWWTDPRGRYDSYRLVDRCESATRRLDQQPPRQD